MQKLKETFISAKCSMLCLHNNHQLQKKPEDKRLSDVSVKSDMKIGFGQLNLKSGDKNIMFKDCRSVSEYEIVGKISNGTYGVVYKASEKQTGTVVALKKLKTDDDEEDYLDLVVREIELLSTLHHPSIVNLREVVKDNDSGNTIFLVMEHMDTDIWALIRRMKTKQLCFSTIQVKFLMMQLLQGVCYLHENNVLHRDLKTANLLVNKDCRLKICDFGLSRRLLSNSEPLTTPVVTLWYRAPELLLGTEKYSSAIDVWSVGCVMAELLHGEPLFRGKTEIQVLEQIFRALGVPNEETWPGLSKLPGAKPESCKQEDSDLLRKLFQNSGRTPSFLSDSGLDLLKKLLTYDPQKRVTARDSLNHEWFHEFPFPESYFVSSNSL